MKKLLKKQKGFTLVELLVVIAILGILATVSVVGYTTYIANARNSNAQTELVETRTALMAASFEKGASSKEITDVAYVSDEIVSIEGITYVKDTVKATTANNVTTYSLDPVGDATADKNKRAAVGDAKTGYWWTVSYSETGIFSFKEYSDGTTAGSFDVEIKKILSKDQQVPGTLAIKDANTPASTTVTYTLDNGGVATWTLKDNDIKAGK